MKFRTQYLIQPKFQLVFSALLVFIALISAALVGIVIYQLIYANNLVFVKYNVHLNPEFMSLLAKERKIILLAWILSFLSVALILLVAGIFLSHKMAGPLYALTREMGKLKMGNLTAYLKLRKRDEFNQLKAPFNQWVDALRKMTINDIEKIDLIKKDLDELIRKMREQNLDTQEISKIEALLTSLDTLREKKEAQLAGNVST